MSTTLRNIALTLGLLALAGCGGKSVEELIAQADQHMAGGDYQSATVELKNALQQDGSSPRARWLLGKLYLDTGDVLSAEKELLRARELGWDASDITPALARTQLAQGEYSAVLALSGDNLEAPAAARLLATQAAAQLALGETASAEKLVAAAFARDPDSVDAKMAEARVLATRGDATGALIVLEEVLSDAPQLGPAWSLKGDILMYQQLLPEAAAAFDQAIALQKNNFPDRLKRALVNLQRQDFEAAQADATVLLKAAPQHPAGNYVQGILYFQEKQYAQAITALSVAEPAAEQYPLTLFYLGSAHLMEGNRDQAALFAGRFVKLLPEHVAGRKLLALLRLQQGKFTAVQDLLQPVLDSNPDDTGALNIMANALLRDGKTEEGLTLLTRIVELQPDSPAAQVRLGAGLLMTGKDDAAVAHMETALTLDPEFQQADILLIMNQLRKKNFQGAIEAAQAFRRRNPGQVAPHNVLGKVYLASGQPDEARAAFEKALELEPGDPAANHSLAAMAIEAGDLAAARRYYSTILKHHENSLSALMQLAALDAREMREQDMVAHLEQAMASHPDALQPRLMLARYYLRSGQSDQVAPLFATLTDLQKQSPQVLQMQALAQLSGNQHAAASYTLEQLIAASPNTPSSHHLLAMAAEGSGDRERARQQLQRALTLDENYGPSLLAMARLALTEGDLETFNHYLPRLEALAPESAEVLGLRAAAAQQQGKLPEAVELAARAYTEAPTTETLLRLALYHNLAGNTVESRRLQQAWIAQYPQDILVRTALASALQSENRVEEAMAQYEAILETNPDNVTALNNLAWYLREEDRQRAHAYIRRAAEIAPDRPEVLDTLAVIEYLDGDYRRARRSAQRALAVAPDNPSLRYHQAMIDAAAGNRASALAILRELLENSESPFAERAAAVALLARLEDE